MQVSLISYTPNAELTIAAAARVSSSTIQATDFLVKLTPQQVSDLLGQLISAGHLSGAELRPKCYRLGYCDKLENYGLFPAMKGQR